MTYYNAEQSVTAIGTFVGYLEGGYVFHLENDDLIDFDRINKQVLDKFDLKSSEFKEQKFELYYSEIYDDLDDEDIVIFKLNDLKLL